MVRSGLLFTAIIMASSVDLARAEALPGNPVDGEHLATAQCSTCHAVGRQCKDSQQAPSFSSIAQMRSTTSLSLHVFLVTPHANMPNYQFTQKEIDDVVSYILSLRDH